MSLPQFMKSHINLNTLLMAVGMSLLGYIGKQTLEEVRTTHDAMIELRGKMVNLEQRVGAVEMWINQNGHGAFDGKR